MNTFGENLLRRFREQILRERLVEPGDRLLIAVSGGPDSTALLILLHALAPELGLSLAVAHLDHGLRGETARRDARWVKKLATRLGLPCVLGNVDVKKRAAARKESIEEAAREARYEFLIRASARMKISKIVFGHQADDLAETVLMRLLRGCGPEGLIAMRPVSRRGRFLIVRPLLPFWRREIAAYLRSERILFRVDASNRSPRFLRNRIRRTLIPYLEKKYNPRIKEILVQLSRLEGKRAKRALRALRADHQTGALKNALAAASAPALNRRHWVALESLSGKKNGARVSLPGGLAARKQGGRLVLIKEGAPVRPRSYRYRLSVPGAVEVKEAGVKIVARLVRRPTLPRAKKISFRGYWRRIPPGEGGSELMPQLREYFDPDKVSPPLIVRSRLPGDRYRPLGPGGSRKVKDIFIDEKIPPAVRELIPVIADKKQVVWIAGHRPSEDCRVASGARRILELRVVPLR
ncbi:MAG: tRNA lysidine(34) synthetase TilS, partial [Candidatus Aureabacteria bacterium]|nr:tRNA lysidine(34) synthetase TilS [Candidatus Auribacterota bacterium]